MIKELEAVVNEMLNAGHSRQFMLGLMEQAIVKCTLKRTNGNQCRAAKRLNIHRNTFERQMKRLGVQKFGPSSTHGNRKVA